DPWLQPSDSDIGVDVIWLQLISLETLRQYHVRVGRHELESGRHNTNHLSRPRINCDHPPKDGWVCTEPAFPISIAQNDGLLCRGSVVSCGEPSSERRMHTDCRQGSVCHHQCADFFRVADSGDACSACMPQPELLKGFVLLAVSEIHRRRQPDV